MSRGPTAAPRELKLLKGERPYRINDKEPKRKSVSGAMPPGWGAHMTAVAKRFWAKYGPVLADLGVLTEADLPAFRVLSELWSKWGTCSRMCDKKGLDLKDWLALMRMTDKIETQKLRYMQEFGMTPSGRGKITIVGKGDDDDEGFLD